MQTITHPELVTALLKPGAEIASQMTELEADLWHTATGISGEAGEILEAAVLASPGRRISRNNMLEELGDIEFYLQGYRAALNLPRQASAIVVADILSHTDRAQGLTVAASRLLDLTKKVVLYKKPLDAVMVSNITAHLLAIEFWLELIRNAIGFTYEETVDANIVKLATGPNARYKAGTYSNEAAQARADKQVN